MNHSRHQFSIATPGSKSPGIDQGSQFASVRVYRGRVLSIMVLLDGNVVDKHQMSIDAGRAVLTVAAANLVSATCYATAVVVEICLIFRN
jgi:hypothetical protein